MAVANARAPLIPDFDIIINGNHFSPENEAHIMAIKIDDDVNLPSMFTLKLSSSDTQEEWSRSDLAEIPWIDDEELFSVGNGVELKMGYLNDLETVIKGEITGLEPEFAVNGLPNLTVRGYDRSHRLLRGRKTRTFRQDKDSGIATKIANELGLTPSVEDTRVVHDYVIQANQTDMEFLQQRAKQIHYEVFVEDKTLFFRAVKNAESEILTLTFDEDLLEFYPRLSTMRQVSEVNVGGWSPKDKKAIFGMAKKGDEVSKMGGQNLGPEIAEDPFGHTVNIIGDRPVMTTAEADQIAIARFNNLALSLIRGDGVCRGRTDLRAGKVIKIEGIGQRFTGQYYLTTSTHTYSSHSGYFTNFSVLRNGS